MVHSYTMLSVVVHEGATPWNRAPAGSETRANGAGSVVSGALVVSGGSKASIAVVSAVAEPANATTCGSFLLLERFR
jgi:hypothetical protein